MENIELGSKFGESAAQPTIKEWVVPTVMVRTIGTRRVAVLCGPSLDKRPEGDVQLSYSINTRAPQPP